MALWGGESGWLAVGFGAGQLFMGLFLGSNSSNWAGGVLAPCKVMPVPLCCPWG